MRDASSNGRQHLWLRSMLSALPDDLDAVRAVGREVDDWDAVLALSRSQGVLGVVLAGLDRAGVAVPAATRVREDRFLLVEDMRQTGLRRALATVLAALAREGVANVALKGPFLAARLYAPHEHRPSSDLDILLEPASLHAAARSLATLGYALEGGDRGRFFRENHHHVHFLHPSMPLLEVHLEAYRGFGTSLVAAPLLARSIPCDVPGLPPARVLSPEDEWIYLAVHGAGHRFERLGWLYDLKLLARAQPALDWGVIASRAKELRVATAVGLAATLLTRWLGVRTRGLTALARPGRVRTFALERLAQQRSSHYRNAVAALGFATLACDTNAVGAFGANYLRVKLLHELPLRLRARVPARRGPHTHSVSTFTRSHPHPHSPPA